MARTKKDTGEEKPVKGVKYSENKPEKGMLVNREKYLLFLDIYHQLRPYLEKPPLVVKDDLLKKYSDNKELVEDVWMCVNELKLVWPQDMMGRIFSQQTDKE